MKKSIFIFMMVLTSCNSMFHSNYKVLNINQLSPDVYDIYLQNIEDHSKVYAIPSNDNPSVNEGVPINIGDTLHVKLEINKARKKMRKNNKPLYQNDTLMYNNINVNMNYYIPCLDGLYLIDGCEN